MSARREPPLRGYVVTAHGRESVDAAHIEALLDNVPLVVKPPSGDVAAGKEGAAEAAADAQDTFLLVVRRRAEARLWRWRQQWRQGDMETWAVECPARRGAGDGELLDTNYACYVTRLGDRYGRAFVRAMLGDWMERGPRTQPEWDALDDEISKRLKAWEEGEEEAQQCVVCGCSGILDGCDRCGQPICPQDTKGSSRPYFKNDVDLRYGVASTDFCPECLIEVEKRVAPRLAPRSVARGRKRTLWLLAFLILTPPALPCVLILKCAGIVVIVVPLPFVYLAVMLAALPLHLVVFPWRWAGLKLGWSWTDVYPRRQDWSEG